MRAALTASVALVALGTIACAAEPGTRPDETALRYYASQNQRERVEAEAARLRTRFPGWTPPADLWTAQAGGEDEDAFWDLLAARRDADLRAALAARAAAEPGWKPSPALGQALDANALREACLPLMKAGRWPELADLATRRRAAFEAAEPELVWAAAEAFGRTERQPEAYALLHAALSGGRFGPEERRVSLLRALRFLPMADIDRLAALGPAADLDPIRVDLARGRISAVLHDEAGQSVSAGDRAAFEAYAETAQDPDQPALVAWLAFKQRELPAALAWFKRAMTRGGDAMVAHGLAHTLRLMGFRRDAEEVAYAWREPLVNNTLLFIDLLETDLTKEIPPAIEPERLKRYAEVTLASASGEGAQALGWYAYNACQFDAALSWFRRAVAWFPKEATVYGYALSQRRMHQERAFLETVNRYDGLFPKVVDLLFKPAEDRPMPCEAAPRRPAAPAAAPSGYLDLAPPGGQGGSGKRGRVPQPDEIASGRVAAMPSIRRSDFPIAVTPENDVRAAPTGSPVPEPRFSERRRGSAPTVARRVPGVGPMPYERYGFSLLPAWDGTDVARAPTAAEAPAPAGTLWAEERSGTTASARSPAEPITDPRAGAPTTTGAITAQAVRNQTVREINP
ncbi:hypothetical protein Q8W71_10320 [Methylobacterium sp. NEAU 140]|uniref:hypothetical protein n=1 Tax=Methylobacterium sp. NEAU 140 TaxID=3064945 RepID=UPI00273251E6|nr:hypothetical protein [Methylobacterium sp. NEAU 140]MDP4023019.1 hypothetical protein [Methylobacterium sp. NEAU 140]